MANLAENLQVEFDPVATDDAIIRGQNYRFTLLSSRLIRMEFDPRGQFEDRASQVFWYRQQEVPEYEIISDDRNSLKLETEDLILDYQKDTHKFNENNLKITLKGSGKVWSYGNSDPKNLKGTVRTLDQAKGSINLDQGLVSRSGWAVVDDSDSLVFESDSSWLTTRDKDQDYQDLYFFGYGREYLDSLKDFTKLAGKTPLIPRWALGNWWSRFWEYSEEELTELMIEFKEREIPISVCVIDMDWHRIDNPTGWTGYTWNKELFPKPARFLKWLKEQGIRNTLNLHPAAGVQSYEERYEEMAEFMGIDPNSKVGVEFDITDPKFIEAYFKILHHPLEEEGVDFWWLDWQQGKETKLTGLDPLWALNHLHFYDSGRNEERPFIFSHWSGLGGHRYQIGFSGDTVSAWDTLKFQPYFTATAANVNYGWWSHDIGGHCRGIEDPELYTRWVEFGVFSPIMRLHCTKYPYLDRAPWSKGVEAYEISKEYMQLRQRLIPYLYTMNRRSHQDDVPLILSMYYHHAEDELAYLFENQYYFGSELVVAPYLEPRNEETGLSRKVVWLPEGDWFNFFSGEYYQGDSCYAEYGPLDEVPIFAKAGAIVPLEGELNLEGVDLPSNLELKIFAGADNSFSLYEDDGVSKGYHQGAYAITEFSQSWQDNYLEFKINKVIGDTALIPEQRDYQLNFIGIKEAKQVEVIVDGKEYNYQSSYQEATDTLMINLAAIKATSEVIVKIEKESGLLAKRDRLVTRCRKLLNSFRMELEAKYAIERAVAEHGIEDLSYLKDFAVVLNQQQLKTLIEYLAGVGIAKVNTFSDENFMVLWNNNQIDFNYNLSCWDVITRQVWSEGERVSQIKVIDQSGLRECKWRLEANYSALIREEYQKKRLNY